MGCEATVAAQNADRAQVEIKAKEYAKSNQIDTVLFMELGSWYFTTIKGAIERSIPFSQANIIYFHSLPAS